VASTPTKATPTDMAAAAAATAAAAVGAANAAPAGGPRPTRPSGGVLRQGPSQRIARLLQGLALRAALRPWEWAWAGVGNGERGRAWTDDGNIFSERGACVEDVFLKEISSAIALRPLCTHGSGLGPESGTGRGGGLGLMMEISFRRGDAWRTFF
jgi:hypothetical protein